MADLHTFWNELDALPTEETPLTAAESDRLADAVLAKVHVESGEAPRKNLYAVQNPPSAAAFLSGAGHWPESPPAWPYCAGSIQ